MNDAVPQPISKDRRPSGPRAWGWLRALAAWCARMGISPNAISLLSVACACIAAWLFFETNSLQRDTLYAMQFPVYPPDSVLAVRWHWLLAGALIGLRGLLNILDGLVAVEGGKGTAVGALYNEVPDRFSDVVYLIGLGFALGGDPILGCFAALGALGTAYVRQVGAGLGYPQDFSGIMAKQQRVYLVLALCLFLTLFPHQALFWPATNAFVPGPAAVALLLIIVGCAITCITRLTTLSRRLQADR